MQIESVENVDESARNDTDRTGNTTMTQEYNEELEKEIAAWKQTDQYLALPENVRHAVELSRRKSKHSDFYYILKELTDKIDIYTSVFYNRRPKYHDTYLRNKMRQKELLAKEEQ